MALFFPQCVKKVVLYISVHTPQGRDLSWRPDFVKQRGLRHWRDAEAQQEEHQS